MNDFDSEELRRLERATAPFAPFAPDPDAAGFVDGNVEAEQDAAELREGWVVATSLLGAPFLLSIDERQLVRQVLKRSARKRVRQRALVAAMLLVCGGFAWSWRRHSADLELPPIADVPAKNMTATIAKSDPAIDAPKSQLNHAHRLVAKHVLWDDENVDDDLAAARQGFVQLHEGVRSPSGSFEGLGRDLNALEADLLETKL